MDGQEYLNQISAANRPVNTGGKFSNILSSKFFLIGIIVVVLFIAMAIFGTVISGSKGSVKDNLTTLKLRLDNTTAVIDDYRPKVKSSILRSDSVTLTSVFSDTNMKITNYLVEKYAFEEKKIDQKVLDEATLEKDGLEADLFEAKINGILDRIYAHKMAYEISLITSREAQLIKTTNNETLKSALTTSYNSLNNLYDKFNDFSETN